ncbi:hypothetical protein [Serratia sp. S119]|uniref:hypothetical protein n=1 Tax=Serratia sp. S119 TaxID=1118230 RepID=UPI001FEDB001|nr:hypothetical protein [Serratia sp. S119]
MRRNFRFFVAYFMLSAKIGSSLIDGDRDVKAERGADLSDGKTLFWLEHLCLTCVPSQKGNWHVCSFKREESRWDDTIALLKGDEVQFSVKLGNGSYGKAHCVSLNGTFIFSIHGEPDNRMKGIIVMSSSHKELFRVETSSHLISAAISEFGQYIALSFAMGKDTADPYSGRLEVIDLSTGEVKMSVEKSDKIYHASLDVLEPDGEVFATSNGKSVLVYSNRI